MKSAGRWEDWVNSLKNLRSWTIAEPRLVQEVDMEDLDEEGSPYEDVGLLFGIYSNFAPWKVHPEGDRQLLTEVRTLLDEAASFSETQPCEWEVDYAGEQIGNIRGGRLGKTLLQGLIEPWEKLLGHPQFATQ